MSTNFQDDIPHLKYKIYLKVQNVDGFIRHQVVMLLYVSKVPIVECLTSAGPDMEFVKKFTHPDFQAKSFTPQKCVTFDIFLAN